MFAAAHLNSKDRKRIVAQLEEQYAFTGDLKEYTLYLNEKKKIYLTNLDLGNFETEGLRIDAMGLYFGQIMRDGDIRLSIEGSQLIGPHCSKNILELDKGEYQLWIRGQDFEKGTEQEGFVIIKHQQDFLGSGKPIKETGLLHNYIPKTRYVRGED